MSQHPYGPEDIEALKAMIKAANKAGKTLEKEAILEVGHIRLGNIHKVNTSFINFIDDNELQNELPKKLLSAMTKEFNTNLKEYIGNVKNVLEQDINLS